ncbi:response regulator [Cohnella suwonensis]|uniref:Response regulator n=1 Tax=Cohnella suwonensis TaxID=696072 RepID=A0ABW0LQN4_9BACL
MVNVVVVDDEERIRQGLAKLVAQAGEDVRVTGIFAGGQELLAHIDEIEVDLVITDIKMPVMNGLELIEKLQKREPSPRMAIISGFDEFSYARQALRFGVEDYLLKPVDKEELAGLIRKVAQGIERSKESELSEEEDRLKLLLFNETESLPEHLRLEACRRLDGTETFREAYGVLIVRGAPSSDSETASPTPEDAIFDWLQKRVLLRLGGRTVAIVPIGEAEHADRIRELGQTLLQRLPVGFEGRVGGSDVFRGSAWLREAYRQAEIAMEHAWYENGRRAFADYARAARKLNANAVKPLLVLLDGEFQAEMAASNYKRAQDSVHRWFDGCMALAPAWNELRDGCETVLALIGKHRADRAGDAAAFREASPAGHHSTSLHPEHFPNKEAFAAFFIGEADKLFMKLQESTQGNRVVDTVKQYIQRNFAAELELNRLAEEVFLTPSYLSKLFKTETGETITDYLISVRIDRAKEWLRDKNALKTYEVGENVGYPDPAYFNKVFKKVVGCTPKEFKDRVR